MCLDDILTNVWDNNLSQSQLLLHWLNWSLTYFLCSYVDCTHVKWTGNLDFETIHSEPHVVLKSWTNMILELLFKWPEILNFNYIMDRSLIYFLGPLLTDLTDQTDRQYWIWNQSIRTLHCSEILINAMVSLIWTSFLKS